MGAVAGCAIGAATSGDCAKGAIIGAVAGFLISWYFESQKLESAQTVNKEYAKAKNKNSRPPKNDVVPVTFTSKLEEEKPDASGRKEVKITSNTDLIGYGDKVPDVQQKYAIYDQNNKLVEEKTEKITSVDGAGRYQTSSKFKIAANAKDYTVKTQLISNNKMYKENSYKVSFSDDGNLTLMAQIQRDSASRIQ